MNNDEQKTFRIRSRHVHRHLPALDADVINGPKWMGKPGFCFRAAPYDRGAGQGIVKSERSMPQPGEWCQAETEHRCQVGQVRRQDLAELARRASRLAMIREAKAALDSAVFPLTPLVRMCQRSIGG